MNDSFSDIRYTRRIDEDACTHLLIVAGGDRANPEYNMVLRFGAGG